MESSLSSINGYEDLLRVLFYCGPDVGCIRVMVPERSFTLSRTRLTGAGKQTPLVLMTTNIIDFVHSEAKHAALSYFQSYTIALTGNHKMLIGRTE